MRTTSSYLPALLLAGHFLAGCFDGRSEVSDAGRDAATTAPDAGGLAVQCGDARCRATESDARWGAEPCCTGVDDSECGLRAPQPRVSYAGTEILVSTILEQARADGQEIANTAPQIECMPRDQAGAYDARCADATVALPGGPAPIVVDAGSADAGSADAGVPTPGAPSSFEVTACCRPDGYCGYLDPTTDFGCVRITQSLVGMALGHPDVRCD